MGEEGTIINKETKINIAINWCFFLYIIVLLGERLQSLIRSLMQGPDFAFSSFMVGLYNVIVMASLLIGILLLALLNRDFLKGLFSATEVNYGRLWLTSGVILVSGMIHTDYTILVVQFVSYAFLLVALILKTILLQEGKNKPLLWVSLCYLMAFSMAIPVNYITYLDMAPLFHAIQLITTAITLIYFTYLSNKVFMGEGEHLLLFIPFIAALLGGIFLIVFRWSEYQNIFLLIALIATAIFFIIGKALELKRKKA